MAILRREKQVFTPGFPYNLPSGPRAHMRTKAVIFAGIIISTVLVALTVPAVGQPVQQERTNRVVQERTTTDGGYSQDTTTARSTDRYTTQGTQTQEREQRTVRRDATDSGVLRSGEVESERALAGWGTAWWQASLSGGERTSDQTVRADSDTRTTRQDQVQRRQTQRQTRDQTAEQTQRRQRQQRQTQDNTASGTPVATVQQTGEVQGDNTTLVQNIYVTVERYMGGLLGAQSQFQQRSQGTSSAGGVVSQQQTTVREDMQLSQNGDPVRVRDSGQQQAQIQAVGQDSRAMNEQNAMHNTTFGDTRGQASVSQQSQAAGPGPTQIGSQQDMAADLTQDRMPVMSVEQGSSAAAPGGAAQVSEQFALQGQGAGGTYSIAEMNNGSTFGGNASATLSQGAQAGIPPQ